jgi:hypothetical protein
LFSTLNEPDSLEGWSRGRSFHIHKATPKDKSPARRKALDNVQSV